MKSNSINPLILCAICWASPTLSVAQTEPTLPKACSPEDPQDCVQPLIEGETSPFTGQLLTLRRAARLAVQAGGCQERVDLERQRVKEIWGLKLDSEQQLRENDAYTHKMKEDLLMKRMAQMEEILAPRWYEKPIFVAALTVAGCVAMYVASVETVKALK